LQHSLFQKATYYFSQKNYLEAAHFFLDVLSEGTSPKLRAQTERVANNLFLNAGKHYEKVGEPLKAQPFYEAIVRYFKPGPAYDHAEKRLDELKSVVEEVDKPPAWLVID
jgi:tetratricopeptide (TPR) repeat protein